MSFIRLADLAQIDTGTKNATDLSVQLAIEAAIQREIDDLTGALREWQSVNGSGFGAVLDRLRGSPELPVLRAEGERIKAQILQANVTAEGRERLMLRAQKVYDQILPGDIRLVVGGAALVVGFKVVSSLASLGAGIAAKKAQERLTDTRFGKKIGLTKRRKRVEYEDEDEG